MGLSLQAGLVQWMIPSRYEFAISQSVSVRVGLLTMKTWCWFQQKARKPLLLAFSLLLFTGCGYSLNNALRDSKANQDSTRLKAVNYLSAFIAQRTNTRKVPEQRLKAIKALGRVPARKSINTLRLVLMHETDSVLRREAIRSLGNLQAREALLEVREALRKDKDLDVRMAAAATLGRLGDRGARKDLILSLKDPQPAVRTAAVRALTEMKVGVAVPRMVDALLDNHIDVRMAASNGLVKIKKQALPYLIKELSFQKAKRRKQVAIVLGRFGKMAWIPLIKAFAKRPSRKGAQKALEAASSDTATWAPLGKLLDDPNLENGPDLVKQIGGGGSLVSIQAVFTLWQKIAVGYRLKFREALGKITMKIGPPARTLLDQVVQGNQDLSARSTAIFALGFSGEEAVPSLRMYLENNNSVIKKSAMLALGRTGEPGLEVLKPYLKSSNEEMRLTAVRALKFLKSSKTVDILLTVLNDKVATIRMAALKSLANQGDKRAIPAVRSMLKDKFNDVVLTAIQTLLKLGDEKDLKLYIAAIKYSPYPPDPSYVKTLGELGDQQVIPLLERLVRKYIRRWKTYRRKSKRLYRKYRRKRKFADENDLLNAIQQKMAEHIAAQNNAICSVIEAIRALTKLNQPAFRTLQKAGYRSTSRFNPLQSPPKACPWPSFK